MEVCSILTTFCIGEKNDYIIWFTLQVIKEKKREKKKKACEDIVQVLLKE